MKIRSTLFILSLLTLNSCVNSDSTFITSVDQLQESEADTEIVAEVVPEPEVTPTPDPEEDEETEVLVDGIPVGSRRIFISSESYAASDFRDLSKTPDQICADIAENERFQLNYRAIVLDLARNIEENLSFSFAVNDTENVRVISRDGSSTKFASSMYNLMNESLSDEADLYDENGNQVNSSEEAIKFWYGGASTQAVSSAPSDNCANWNCRESDPYLPRYGEFSRNIELLPRPLVWDSNRVERLTDAARLLCISDVRTE